MIPRAISYECALVFFESRTALIHCQYFNFLLFTIHVTVLVWQSKLLGKEKNGG